MQQEIKPCWKCKTPLQINEYGFSICNQKQKHFDNNDAIVFGDRKDTYKKATEPDSEIQNRKIQTLSYQQKYYLNVTRKKRMLAKQKFQKSQPFSTT